MFGLLLVYCLCMAICLSPCIGASRAGQGMKHDTACVHRPRQTCGWIRCLGTMSGLKRPLGAKPVKPSVKDLFGGDSSDEETKADTKKAKGGAPQTQQ